jgi:hypothetical protein
MPPILSHVFYRRPFESSPKDEGMSEGAGGGQGEGYFFTADSRELLLAKSGTSGWNTSHFRSMGGGGGLPPTLLS